MSVSLEEIELSFGKSGLVIKSHVKVPILDTTSLHEEHITYDQLPAAGLALTVNSIDKKLDESGNLEAIVFKVSSFQALTPQNH